MADPRYPALCQINTRIWLTKLDAGSRAPILASGECSKCQRGIGAEGRLLGNEPRPLLSSVDWMSVH